MALGILLFIPLAFGMGQEIAMLHLPHDDLYFIKRSLSFDLFGHPWAPFKEMLYPLFIRLTWITGLGLRNTQALLFGVAIFSLWLQCRKLFQHATWAWAVAIPLAFFAHQHAVFNRATYDTLALILVVFTLTSCLHMYRTHGSWQSVWVAALIAGLHTVNRPEGFLYVLAPLFTLLFIHVVHKRTLARVVSRLACVILAGVLLQQIASAVNWKLFGFWAPTTMKDRGISQTTTWLMRMDIGETNTNKYEVVSYQAYLAACEASPSLKRTLPYMEQHFLGRGYIFHWLLFDAGASVVGNQPGEILRYFDTVSEELADAAKSGAFKTRRVWSSAIGPGAPRFDSALWHSIQAIGAFHLNLPKAPAIKTTKALVDVTVASYYEAAAFTRPGLYQSYAWILDGWIVSVEKGVPSRIELDQVAHDAGVTLYLINRPDVARLLNLDPDTLPHSMCGVSIRSPGTWQGSLRVQYNQDEEIVPLVNLKNLSSGGRYGQTNVHLHVDTMHRTPLTPAHTWVRFTDQLNEFVYTMMRYMIMSAMVITLLIAIRQRGKCNSVFFATGLCLSILLPRWLLFALIDSNMYLAQDIRYLAPSSFVVWWWSLTVIALAFLTLRKDRHSLSVSS